MASIEDRSNIVVSVARRPGLTKTFRVKETHVARGYVQELKASGHAPDVESEKDRSVFISRSYRCNGRMHRPSQRWTSSWPWGLGWLVFASVFHGGSTGPGGPLQAQS